MSEFSKLKFANLVATCQISEVNATGQLEWCRKKFLIFLFYSMKPEYVSG
jgi:hypothetical protein